MSPRRGLISLAAILSYHYQNAAFLRLSFAVSREYYLKNPLITPRAFLAVFIANDKAQHYFMRIVGIGSQS